jgi:hypothetical protein
MPLEGVGRSRAAFFTNTTQAVRPIAQIDGVDNPLDADCYDLLNACYDSNSLQRI